MGEEDDVRFHCTASYFTVLVLFASLPGCVNLQPSVAPERISTNNTIFNPECTEIDTPEQAWEVWPITVAFLHPAEQVAFREYLIDRQGRVGTHQDFVYRRFDSVRTGRARR